MDDRYKCKTIKLLEENRVENLCDLWFGKEFLDMTPKRWPMKEKWVNWTSSELKPFALWHAVFWVWKDKLHTARKYLEIIYFTKDSVKPGSIKHSQNSTARIQPSWKMGKRLEQALDQLSLLDHLQSASLVSRYEENPKEDALNYSPQHSLSEFYSFLKALILFRLSTCMWDPRQGFFSPSCR